MKSNITVGVTMVASLALVGTITATAYADRAKAQPVAAPRVAVASTSPGAVKATVARAVATSGPSALSKPPTPADPPAPASRGKVIYLTFDDGPDPEWTPQILQLLTENHATATFFDIGENVVGHQYLVRDIRAQGSQVGNHTWDHPSLPGLTNSQITRELDRTDHIQGVARCVRPPYGATNNRVNALIRARGQRVELWNVDTRDWARPGVAAIVQQLLDARSGSTVLMHTGGGNRSETVAALRYALPKLRAEGFVLQGIPGC